MAVDQDGLLSDIHAAILNDDAEQLNGCCRGNSDLDEQFTPQINPQHVGMTPVALACALNKPDLARILLENGANPNATFATLNTTSLMTAAFHGHTEVVKLLLDYGADVCAIDLQQSTALGYAFGGTRSIDVVELLLQAGVDVNRKNMLGMNALLLVAGYGNDQLVEMILRAGADPNTTNEFGHSALHLSVVGKKDQMRKLKCLGSVEAAAADKSLNRRNLDLAMKEWARFHKDAVVGSKKSEDALDKAGKFMMNIGQKMDDGDLNDDLDDQEAMKRRVEAVWKYRQEKIQTMKNSKKGGVIGSLLSCGGGKSHKASNTTNMPTAKPYVHSEEYSGPKEKEVKELNERCTRILRMLIENGCDINCTEKTFGMTALDMAILNGDIESTALLVSYEGDEDHLMKMFASSDLYEVLVLQTKKDLKELLSYDTDLDINMSFSRFNITHKGSGPEGLEDVSDEGLTPLTVAVRTNDADIVKMLIKQGADVNDPGLIGRCPIHEAAAKGYIKMMQILLSNKADPEQPSTFFKNATAIVVAVIFRQHEAVRLLLKNGCKVDLPMVDGRVALFKAIEAQDMDMVDILLEADLAANYIDPQGFMAAMAQKYQTKTRDVDAILNEATDVVRGFNEREAAMEAEENMRREQDFQDRQRVNVHTKRESNVPVESKPKFPRATAPNTSTSSSQPAYIASQPSIIAAEPAQPGFVVEEPVKPGFVLAEPSQPNYVEAITSQSTYVEANALQQELSGVSNIDPPEAMRQSKVAVPPQPQRSAPVPQKQGYSSVSTSSDESNNENDDDPNSESITDSSDDHAVNDIDEQHGKPLSTILAPITPNSEDDEEEEEEEEDEEEIVMPSKAVPVIASIHDQVDDLDDISDSSEEEESSESEDEDVNEQINGNSSQKSAETAI